VLSRLKGLDADFAEIASVRDEWIGARLRIASRQGSLSPNARFFLANEINLGRIGGRLPDGVGESSLAQLRALLGMVVASFHAHPDE